MHHPDRVWNPSVIYTRNLVLIVALRHILSFRTTQRKASGGEKRQANTNQSINDNLSSLFWVVCSFYSWCWTSLGLCTKRCYIYMFVHQCMCSVPCTLRYNCNLQVYVLLLFWHIAFTIGYRRSNDLFACFDRLFHAKPDCVFFIFIFLSFASFRFKFDFQRNLYIQNYEDKKKKTTFPTENR